MGNSKMRHVRAAESIADHFRREYMRDYKMDPHVAAAIEVLLEEQRLKCADAAVEAMQLKGIVADALLEAVKSARLDDA